nr:NAD-dependent epimerase/dehydratase family protein [Microbacterium bovistercoris]
MKLLLLGGTAWLGRTVAAAARDAGHDVTCVARGSDVPPGVALVHADRDRDDALASLARTRWDAVIDVARQPGQVRRAVRALEPVAGISVFVSTVSVYASHAERGADENAETLAPLDADVMDGPEQYGPAKVACEHAVLAGFGPERSAIVRPGLIGGPGDGSGRTTYWVRRLAHPSTPAGTVLVPDAPDLPTSVIDVRDLADWLVRLAAERTAGTFNAVGDPMPFPAHLQTARDVAGHTGALAAASADWLRAHDVDEWAGPRSLPLWLADRDAYGMGDRSNARARAAGLALRPLAETLADILAATAGQDAHGLEVHGAGLTDDEERALLAACAAG